MCFTALTGSCWFCWKLRLSCLIGASTSKYIAIWIIYFAFLHPYKKPCSWLLIFAWESVWVRDCVGHINSPVFENVFHGVTFVIYSPHACCTRFWDSFVNSLNQSFKFSQTFWTFFIQIIQLHQQLIYTCETRVGKWIFNSQVDSLRLKQWRSLSKGACCFINFPSPWWIPVFTLAPSTFKPKKQLVKLLIPK